MQNFARFQGVIEIITEFLNSAAVPIDRLLTDYFRKRRFIGSGDRRFLTQTVYSLLRSWPSLGLDYAAANGRQAVIQFLAINQKYSTTQVQEIFSGGNYAPAPLTSLEREMLSKNTKSEVITKDWARAQTPEWLWPLCQASFADDTFDEMNALNQVAGLDLRINSLKTNRNAVINELQALSPKINFEVTKHSPLGIRMTDRHTLKDQKLWQSGFIEVQDEGSQIISLLTDAKPGMQVLDLCAGAGGKTLALAATMENKGKIFATDIYEWRLNRAKERLRRAGVFNVECRTLKDSWLKRQNNRFDRVLVDAPCSGTGTWRRNPDLKVKLKPADLHELIQKQDSILNEAAPTVKQGGRLIYATCSILKAENNDQVESFLQKNRDFAILDASQVWEEVLFKKCPSSLLTSLPTLQLTPNRSHTDGFFISIFEKK